MTEEKQENEELKTAWAETDRALLERDEAAETVEALSQDLAEAEATLQIMQEYANDIEAAAVKAVEALEKKAEQFQ